VVPQTRFLGLVVVEARCSTFRLVHVGGQLDRLKDALNEDLTLAGGGDVSSSGHSDAAARLHDSCGVQVPSAIDASRR
jgi:hypothetical protein